MKKQSVPCYIRNGGEHEIVNIPLGMCARVHLKMLCRELLQHAKTLETFVAAKATPQTINLLIGLLKILSIDLKPKANREAGKSLCAANEKNLKPSAQSLTDETVNLVQFAISCGLVALLFIGAAFLENLERANY